MTLQSGKNTDFCRSCLWPKSRYSKRCPSCATKKQFDNPEMWKKMSLAQKNRYANSEERIRTALAIKNSPAYQDSVHSCEYREKHSKTTKKYYEDPENRKKMGEHVKRGMAKPGVREKFSGANSGQWRGGLIRTPYGSAFNECLKKRIRIRDDYLCQNPKCYLPENGRKHPVHHIDYNKKNNSSLNLITLCIKCHTSTTSGDHDYWMEYYQALQETRGIHPPGRALTRRKDE